MSGSAARMGATGRVALLADQYFNPSGVGVYTRQLIDHVTRVRSDLEYLVLLPTRGYGDSTLSLPKGVRVERMPDRRVLYPLWHLLDYPPLDWLVSDFGIVHVLSGGVRVASGRPCIYTITDLASVRRPADYPWRRRWFKRRLLLELRRRTDRVVAISESTKRDLVNFGVDESRVTTTWLGVDRERFRPVVDRREASRIRTRYGLPDQFYLFVGILSPRKNAVLLLRAYERLTAQLQDPPALVIAGPPLGWKDDEVYRVWKTLKSQARIKFVGFVEHGDIPVVYNAALALVYPSLYEGFGLPILEAMACGVPVICSRATSLPEVAGDAAYYVSGQDVEELTDAMVRVGYDGRLREELRGAGFQRVNQFSWQECARATVRLHEEVLRLGA